MESAYLERNQREFELTQHISLAPMALLKLKRNGKCNVTSPEVLYDLVHCGHYMRRLKTVALSVPCVTGPYPAVGGKPTLQSSRYRRNPSPGQGDMSHRTPNSVGHFARYSIHPRLQQSRGSQTGIPPRSS